MEVVLDKNKLRSCRDYRLGCLITLRHSSLNSSGSDASTLAVLGHCACSKASKPVQELESLSLPTPNWTETVNFAKHHYPGGCDVGVGVWVSVDAESAKTPDQIWKTLVLKTDILRVLTPRVLIAIPTDSEEVECFLIDSQSSTLDRQSIKLRDSSVKEYLENNTALFRLLTSVRLCLPQDQTVSSALASVESFITDPSTVFYLPSKTVIFSESTPVSSTVKGMLQSKTKSKVNSPLLLSSSQHLPHVQSGPISIDLLTDNSLTPNAPTLKITNPLPSLCVKMSIPVDILALVHCDLSLSEVSAVLKEKILNHLQATVQSITWKEGSVSNVTVHHIPVWNQHCPVTVIYPHTLRLWEEPEHTTPITTDDLHPYREELHTGFCLGRDMPYLRVPRQLDIKSGSSWLSSNATLSTGPQLLNPHLHLKQTIKEGSLATVQGDYLYYHYMQNGFDDNGWGCAYRSLQTLWSWFLLQGYTTRLPPTHREIQESLVAAKDKPSSLIGSKEWIGSLEVSHSLNQLLQVTCRFENCASGTEMANKGRVLLHHFRTQGTPVTIGGGVLAHTILGVNFNEVTGDIQFLILDPHYTGREDIKAITDKGKWCGWKKVSFWDSKAHYNFCMPLRPDNII